MVVMIIMVTIALMTVRMIVGEGVIRVIVVVMVIMVSIVVVFTDSNCQASTQTCSMGLHLTFIHWNNPTSK